MIGALILGSAATSAATEQASQPSDAELGPAFMLFNTPDGLESAGPDKDKDNGKKKKKGQRSDGDGSQEQECGWSMERSELEFFEKVNNARARHDRPQLKLDPELSRVANYHAFEMARDQKLYHTPGEKMKARITNWEILGENVGRGASVESLHQAFMESRSHREVVLYRTFNYVGVGVVEKNGSLWVTVIFEAEDNPGTTMDMSPTC